MKDFTSQSIFWSVSKACKQEEEAILSWCSKFLLCLMNGFHYSDRGWWTGLHRAAELQLHAAVNIFCRHALINNFNFAAADCLPLWPHSVSQNIKKSILYDPSIISIKEFVLRYNIITYTESEVIFIRRSLWQNVFILIFPQASHQIWSRQCGGAWAQARSAPSLLQSIVCLTDSWHQMTIQFCFEKGRKENLGITPGLTCFDPPRCLMLEI